MMLGKYFAFGNLIFRCNISLREGKVYTFLGIHISPFPASTFESMVPLFPRRDMWSFPWRYIHNMTVCIQVYRTCPNPCRSKGLQYSQGFESTMVESSRTDLYISKQKQTKRHWKKNDNIWDVWIYRNLYIHISIWLSTVCLERINSDGWSNTRFCLLSRNAAIPKALLNAPTPLCRRRSTVPFWAAMPTWLRCQLGPSPKAWNVDASMPNSPKQQKKWNKTKSMKMNGYPATSRYGKETVTTRISRLRLL